MSAKIVKACCVLHNICLARNVPLLEDYEEVNEFEMHHIPHIDNQNANADLLTARNIQQQLINNYFQN